MYVFFVNRDGVFFGVFLDSGILVLLLRIKVIKYRMKFGKYGLKLIYFDVVVEFLINFLYFMVFGYVFNVLLLNLLDRFIQFLYLFNVKYIDV